MRALVARPVAHRALHGPGRPENGLAAVRAAVAAGYGIEVDVQPSSDGVAMAFHDEVLGRMTGEAGPVAARTARELGRLTLRGGAEGIPTLVEVLAEVGGRVALLVEVKDQDGALGESVGALEEAVARALRGYDGPVAVMSFNPHAVAVLRDLLPGVPRGLTTSAFSPGEWAPVPPATCDRLRGVPDYDRVGASFISHEARDLSSPRVAELKAQGAAILAWTIRSPEEEAAARRVADQVTFEGYAP
jgi:glycerophosphoryl diester phosphodiesterase